MRRKASVFRSASQQPKGYDDGLDRALVRDFARWRRWVDGDALSCCRSGDCRTDLWALFLRKAGPKAARLARIMRQAYPYQKPHPDGQSEESWHDPAQ
jgi:hypothetical protein